MAATIGALMVDIGANVSRLQYDMNRAQSTVSRAAGNITRTAKTLAGVLGVSFGASAMIKAGNQALETADKYAKMGRSIGMSVETLSAMNHAAELSGVSLTQLSSSAKRLAANMADAQNGTGEAKDTFAQLGISVTDSAGKLRNIDSVMMDVADRFSRMKDGTQKTAAAMDLFGKSGADLIPMLNNGTAGIRDMMNEADRLGLTFDTKTAVAAERFNDQMTRIHRVTDGMVNNIMVKLLPDLENMANLMFSVASNTSEMDYVSKILSNTLKLLMTTGIGTAAAFDVVGSVVGATAATIMAAAEGDFSSATRIMGMASDDVVSKFETAYDRIQKVWSNLPAQVEISRTEIVQDFQIIQTETEKTAKAIEKSTKAATTNMDRSISAFSNSVASTLTDIVMGADKSFKDIAKSFLRMMVQMQMQSSINSIMGSVSGGGGGSGGSNLLGTVVSGVMSYFGSASANANGNVYGPSGRITAFANGGIVDNPMLFPYSGGTGLMGEAGPEAIMPLTRIGGKLGVRADGGGSNMTNHNTFNLDFRGGGQSSEVASLVSKSIETAVDLSYNKILNDLKRGGVVHKRTR